MTLGVRLEAIDAAGESLGSIPDDYGVEAVWPGDGGLPTCRVTIDADAVRSPLVTAPAARWRGLVSRDQGEWVEPPDSRFLTASSRWNRVDGRRVYEVTGWSTRWLLDKALVGHEVVDPYVAPNRNHGERGELAWPTTNAGVILGEALWWAKRRTSPHNTLTWFPQLHWTFTATHDSAGQPWGVTLPVSAKPHHSIADLLDMLVSLEMCEWELRGDELFVTRPGGLQRDRTLGDTAVVLKDAHSTDAPEQMSLADLVTDVDFLGDEGYWSAFGNQSPFTALGRIEAPLQRGGIKQSQATTAALYAQMLLREGSAPRMQFTRASGNGVGLYLPWLDVRPGDRVLREVDAGDDEQSTVVGVSVSREKGVTSWHWTLGDRIAGVVARMAKRAEVAMLGAGVVNGDGTPVSPPDSPDAPAAVGTLATNSSVMDGPAGVPRGTVQIAWPAVTVDVDGDPIEIHHYDVYGDQVDNPGWGGFAAVGYAGDTHLLHGNLTPGERWQYRVRAVSKAGVPGAWSPVAEQVVARDTTPPPPPSQPAVSSALGANTITWDRNGVVGGSPAAMPADFSHCVVTESVVNSDNTVTAQAVVGRVDLDQPSLVLTRVPGTKYRYRLIAVDNSGNQSPTSAFADVRVVSALDDPAIKGAMDGLDADIASIRATAASENKILNGAGEQGGVGGWVPASGAVWATTSPPDGLPGYWTLTATVNSNPEAYAPVDPGAEYFFEMWIRADKPNSTMNIWMVNQAGTAAGVMAPVAGVEYVRTDTTSPTNLAVEGKTVPTTWTRIGGRWAARAGTNKVRLSAVMVNTAAGTERTATVDIAGMRLYKRVGQTLISENSISADKVIAYTLTGDRMVAGAIGTRELWAGSVTADKIASGAITAGKISATAFEGQSFTGGTFTGATFRTSATNPKVEMVGSTNRISGRYTSGAEAWRLDSDTLAFWAEDGTLNLWVNSPAQYQQWGASLWTNWSIIVGTAASGAEGHFKADSINLRNTPMGTTPTSYLNMYLSYDNAQTGMRPTIWAKPGLDINVDSSGGLQLLGNAVRVKNYPYLDALRSGGNSSNLHWSSSDYQVYLIGSMRHLKLDREPIPLAQAEAILDVEPVTWRDRAEVADNPDTTNRIAGLVAEDVQAVSERHGGALDPLIESGHDTQGTSYMSLAYDRIPAYLIPLIRDLRERVAVLEGAAA